MVRGQNERDVVNIGKSVVIKGELSGSEDLTIEGQVEGKIELRQNILTIGPNAKIKAQGTNMLGRILANNTDNAEAVRIVYLRTLARRPTDRESARCLDHIKTVGNRAEAFEDILWALINSTEFQMKR